MPHEQLAVERIVQTSENLSDRIFPLGTLAEHIFLSGRHIKVDTGDTCSFLPAIVLFLQHKVQFPGSIPGRPVLFLIIVQRLQEPYKGNPALVIKSFHIQCRLL